MISLIGAIILLFSLLKLKESYFEFIHTRFGACYTGTMLMLIGLILIIIITIITIILSIIDSRPIIIVIAGGIIAIPAFITVMVGQTLELIVCTSRLNSRYQESLFLIAGILFIIELFVPILPFIATLLLYKVVSGIVLPPKGQGFQLVAKLIYSCKTIIT